MSSKRAKAKAREYYWQHRDHILIKQRGYTQKSKIPCSICGYPMQPRSTVCRACRNRLQTELTGENHPRWKGGRINAPEGYIYVVAPNHPRAHKSNYVMEHIIIWERFHNKSLPQGWIIHHLNGLKSDNRPENLVALPDTRHRHLLRAKAKRIQELEGLLNNQHQLL